MYNDYPSFVNDPNIGFIEYPCEKLHDDGYKLKVSCNINNPDCMKYINDRKSEGCDIKVIKRNTNDEKDPVVHLWVLQK